MRCIALLLLMLAVSPAVGAGRVPPHHARHLSVVGGSDAQPDTFGYVANLSIHESSGGYYECTASVIGPTEILTAAHCVYDVATGSLLPPSAFVVRTGVQDLASADGQVIGVTEVLADPAYRRTTLGYDAALLFLAQPTTAPSIRLATPSDGDLTWRDAWVVGWGRAYEADVAPPRQLQDALVATQSVGYCGYFSLIYTEGLGLCTDVPGGGAGACRGDSGGPLVMSDAIGVPFEAGIFSNVRKPCEVWPSYYTTSTAIATWVAQQIPPPVTPAPTPALPPPGAAIAPTVPSSKQQAGKAPVAIPTSGTVVQDSLAPHIRMFAARLHVGVAGQLVYHVEDDSWHTRELIRVYDRSDRPVWLHWSPFGSIRKAWNYYAAFKPRHAFRGQVCAYAQDRARNWSSESCAPLVVTWH
jgi:hypothetical protein